MLELSDPTPKSPPNPSWALIIVSCLVIAGNLMIVPLAVVAFGQVVHPIAILYLTVLIPLPMVLAYLQYRATFRRDAAAAYRAAAIFVLLALVALYSSLYVLHPLNILVGFGFALTAWMNRRWYWLLNESFWTAAPAPKNKFGIGELMGVTAAIAFMVAIAAYSTVPIPTRQRLAEHVTRRQAPVNLPAGATDISYCRDPSGELAFEFTIDERSFSRWVSAGLGTYQANPINAPPIPIAQMQAIRRYRGVANMSGEAYAIVNDGLFYQRMEGQKRIEAVFDRVTDRAYYHEH